MNTPSIPNDDQLNKITGKVIECALKVHSNLGPGLMESVYEECLLYEIEKIGMLVKTQTILPIRYDNRELNSGYRTDLIVEDKILVELKSVEKISSLHIAQILTYLRLGHFRLGLLINFNVVRLTDGIRRFIHDI